MLSFFLSFLVCLAWIVFSDHFITKSCYYQTKIFAGLVTCALATSLLGFQVIYIKHEMQSFITR